MTRRNTAALDSGIDTIANLLDWRDDQIYGLLLTALRQYQRWGNNPPGALERLTAVCELWTANNEQLRQRRACNQREEGNYQRVIKFPGGGG